jgi:hypothetical protein
VAFLRVLLGGLGLSWGLGFHGTSCASARAAGPCYGKVAIEGEPSLRAGLESLLRDRGVQVDGTSSCTGWSVQVSGGVDFVRVTAVGQTTTAVTRELSTLALAATYVETLVRHDLTDPLLLGPAVPNPLVPLALTPPQSPAAQPPPAAAPQTLELAVAADLFGASDGSVWAGGAALMCARLGPTCLGMWVHAASQVSADPLLAASQRVAALALLQVPVTRGRITVRPGLGIGLGWQRGRIEQYQGQAIAAVTTDQGAVAINLHTCLEIHLRWRLAIESCIAGEAWFLSGSPASIPVTYLSPEGEPLSALAVVNPPPWGTLHGLLGLRWSSR